MRLALVGLVIAVAHGVFMGASASVSVPQQQHEGGELLFKRIWTAGEGLGPVLNAQSCVACHAHPVPGGTSTKTSDYVFVSPDVTDPSGGRVFQIFELGPNGSTTLRPLPRLVARRKPPSLFGLGLLEAAVRPAVEAAVESARRPAGDARPAARGRFGWKNQFATIDDAVAAALANELGLLGPQFARGEAEIPAEQIRLLAQFVRLLPPPPRPRRAVLNATKGRQLFDTLGCGSCHRPTLRTGPSAIPTLRNQVFEPYTDLALHDLGSALSDGFASGDVRGSEFRTPPLWGLGQSGPPYLHDGRAATLEQAIEFHAGEADGAVDSYQRLSKADRGALVAFLRSL